MKNTIQYFTMFLFVSIILMGSAMAARTVNSATLYGATAVTVPPSLSIPASITVTTSSSDNDWLSTSYKIGSATAVCVDTTDHTSSSIYTETFSFPAPSVAGSYNVVFTAYAQNNCAGNNNALTLTNGIVVDDTAWRAPTSTNTPSGATPFIDPTNAYTLNNAYADAQTSSYIQQYGTFNFPTIPTGAVINGIEVFMEAHRDSSMSTIRTFDVSLSWNGGTTLTSVINSGDFGASDSQKTIGGSANTWGRTWSPSDFTNGNFKVQLDTTLGDSNKYLYLDFLKVRVTYILDTTAPTIGVVSITPSSGTSPKYVSGTSTITATVTDAESGIASCEYTINGGTNWLTATYSAGTCTASSVSTTSASSINMRATNGAGLIGISTAVPVTLDTTAPTTTASASGYTFGTWTTASVSVTLTCSDGSGSGCSSIKYCTDTVNSCTPTTTYSSPVAISSQGTNYIRYVTLDNVGNTETTKSSQVKIDSVKPSSSATSPAYANGATISVSFTASDALSGVASTKLYYNKNNAGWTDSTLTLTGTSGSFAFTPSGDGTYQFYTIATDTAGNIEDAPASADGSTIYDTTAPTVSSVTSSTANGNYKAGTIISIQVQFSEMVNVVGTPQLTLETGSSDAVVNYASGSGTNALTFTYTVAAGQTSSDLDYISTTALALNAGTIKDSAGNSATLTLPTPGAAGSLGANKAIVIDTTAPLGGLITYTDGYYTTANVSITYTLGTDSGSGLNAASGKIQRASANLSAGTCGTFGSFSDLVTESDGSYTDASVVSGNCYKYQYLISDNAGNTATYTSTNVVKVDTLAPTVDAGADKTTNVQFTQTGTASDAASGIVSYSWSKQSGPGTLTFGTPSAISTTISANVDGTYVVKLTVTDNAGNSNSDTMTLVWDTTKPTLSPVHIQSNNANPVVAILGNTITLTFSANEAINTPTVTITGDVVTASGSGAGPYTATYLMTSADTAGPITFSIAFSDLAGNAGTPVTGTTDGSSVRYYASAPVCLSKNGGTFTSTSISSGDLAWSNPNNAAAVDTNYATANTANFFGITTQYLNVTNFDFSIIPDSSTIQGIVVNVMKSASSSGKINDYRVRLMKNGVIGSTDKADTNTNWEIADTTISYGGVADTWVNSWAVADIKNSKTGVMFAAQNQNWFDGGTLAKINYINMTVCYTPPPVITSCDCPGTNANWAINLNDNCVLNKVCNIGTGILSFTGTGNFTINSTLTTGNVVAPPAGSTVWIGPNGIWYK